MEQIMSSIPESVGYISYPMLIEHNDYLGAFGVLYIMAWYKNCVEKNALQWIECCCISFQGGDLFDMIANNSKFTEIESAAKAFDLAKGLFYLHSRSIVHRDIKPENILVSNFRNV